MKKADKQKMKKDFKENLKKFTLNLQKFISTDTGDWAVKGFIDVYKNIYTISSDTKIVSKVLEIHILPLLSKFAENIGYSIVPAREQNYYPDYSFVNKIDPTIKFAVDLKTSYRDPKKVGHIKGFTLGSHGKYFKERNSKKNIQFPYSEYSGHFCLCIIYTRISNSDEEKTINHVKDIGIESSSPMTVKEVSKLNTVKDLKSIASVVKGFEFFFVEKWEVASDSKGSHNTANIGSITNINDLKNGNGIFAKLGEHWFDEFWVNYGSVTTIVDGKAKNITKLKDFLEFKGEHKLVEKIVEKNNRVKKIKKNESNSSPNKKPRNKN